MLRILIDTNIYISAVLFKGKPRNVLQDLIEEKFIGYISSEILKEIEDTLLKPKFGLKGEFIQLVISEIRDINKIIKNVPLKDYLNLRDRNDYHILESAFSANVDFLITGDKDLLSLEKISNFRILSPDEYLIIRAEVN
jgi:putative PIN family toxin of toxin-antitoxin system